MSETRNTVVFGAGNADADLMFVGEAPGAEEDRQGLPFVGRAGAFLTELLQGIGMKREEVFIANVLKCRPPGNRDPQGEEIDSCRPWLEKQVELIKPRIIGTLGNFATKLLTGNPTGITTGAGDRSGARDRRPARSICCRSSIPPPGCGPLRSPTSSARTSRRSPACSKGRFPRDPSRWSCARGSRRLSSSASLADPRGLREEPPVSTRTSSAAETEALGERIGAGLGPGDVVLVSGELGAGKTTLIRGACRALGVTEPGHLAHLHDRPPLSRPGARLPPRPLPARGARPGGPGLLDDYLDRDSVVLIEWPERAAASLERVSVRVTIRHAGGDEREIEIVGRKRD